MIFSLHSAPSPSTKKSRPFAPDRTKERTACIQEAYELYRDMLFRIAFVYMKNVADTEDCVQDTFIKLCQNYPAFSSEDHRKAWLIVVCSNLCKDRLRLASRKDISWEGLAPFLGEKNSDNPNATSTLITAHSLSASQPESTAAYLHRKEVLDLIMQLPDRLIMPVYLFYYEGYKGKEIADILQRKPSTIRNQLAEARELLKIGWEA